MPPIGRKKTFAVALAEYLHRVRKRKAVNDVIVLIMHVDPIAKVDLTVANVASNTVPC